MNVVVLSGTLSRVPEGRELPSGSRLVNYEVTVPRPGERAESVPVVWVDPPQGAEAIDAGAEVVAVGRIRRRFFRTGGATQSRTEVVAELVVPVSRKAAVRKAVGRVVAALEDAAPQR